MCGMISICCHCIVTLRVKISRWQGFIDKKRMDVTIDMEKETEIHSVGADFMR